MVGTCVKVSDLELKLRAAGMISTERIELEKEWALRVPVSTSGAIAMEAKLLSRVANRKSYELVYEREIDGIDKEKTVRVVSIQKAELEGKALEVLTRLGFQEKSSLVKIGHRVKLPGAWTVEYFTIAEPRSSGSKRARVMMEDPKASEVHIVVMTRQFDEEKDSHVQVADAWKMIRRMSPELQIYPILSIHGRLT